VEATATSYAITPLGLSDPYNDTVSKPDKGKPMIRSLIYLASNSSTNSTASLKFFYGKEEVQSITIDSFFAPSALTELKKPNIYNIYVNEHLLEENIPLKLGGVYTIVGSRMPKKDLIVSKVITVTQPNKMHMAWMLPQYIIITMAEVMFSITGLQFAFTQAPESMKSLLQAAWLLSVAFGNLIVVLVTQVKFFKRQVSE